MQRPWVTSAEVTTLSFTQRESESGFVSGPFVRWITPEWPEGRDPLTVPLDVGEGEPYG